MAAISHYARLVQLLPSAVVSDWMMESRRKLGMIGASTESDIAVGVITFRGGRLGWGGEETQKVINVT